MKGFGFGNGRISKQLYRRSVEVRVSDLEINVRPHQSSAVSLERASGISVTALQ